MNAEEQCGKSVLVMSYVRSHHGVATPRPCELAAAGPGGVGHQMVRRGQGILDVDAEPQECPPILQLWVQFCSSKFCACIARAHADVADCGAV